MSHDEPMSQDHGRIVPLEDVLAATSVPPIPDDARARILARVMPVPGVAQLRHTRIMFARAAAVFACFGTLMSGVTYAAAHSLPGDALYPLKRAVEEMQVVFAPAESKDDALIERFDTRAEELRRLKSQRSDEILELRAIEGLQDAAGRALYSSPDTSTVQQRVRRIEDAVSDEPARVRERVKTEIPEALPGGTGAGNGDGASNDSGSGSGTKGSGPADSEEPGGSGPTETPDGGTNQTPKGGGGTGSQQDGEPMPVTPRGP